MAGLYIGIDPGKKGFSFEIDSETGRFLRADAQPLIGKQKGDTFDLGEMRRRILRWKEESEGALLVVLEELHPMGGAKGSQAIWNQALGYMAWKAELAALEVRCITKTKGFLKKVMGIPTPSRIPKESPLPKKATKAEKAAWAKRDRARLTRYGKQVKAAAIAVALQYFPDVDFKRTPRCEGPDDNKCEAGLYAVMASKIDPVRTGVV